MAMNEVEDERAPRRWNVWLTLSVIFLAFGFIVVVLEYLGVFRDLGLVLGIFSVGLGLYFGTTGATQKSSELVRFDIRGVRRDLGRVADATVENMGATQRTMGRVEMTMGRLETTMGRVETTLGEIATLLRERLPRP